MLKDFLNPVRWNFLGKRSMHHWKLTANRDTQNNKEGICPTLNKLWTDNCILNVTSVIFIFVPCRFAKLLLRLPALRSIGLKCLEHLFFFKLIGDTPIDTFLMEMLEAPHQLS